MEKYRKQIYFNICTRNNKNQTNYSKYVPAIQVILVAVNAPAAGPWWEDLLSPAHNRNRKLPYPTLLLTLTLNKLEMASTDQPPLDLTEKDTWEKLTLWDRRVDALAPLTEKQMDSVLELRAAAEILSVPSEVRSGSAASQWASRTLLTCSVGVSVRLFGEKKSSLRTCSLTPIHFSNAKRCLVLTLFL